MTEFSDFGTADGDGDPGEVTCAVVTAFSQTHPKLDLSKEHDVVRRFANEELLRSPRGRDYVKLYHANKAQMAAIIRQGDPEVDAVLKEHGLQVLQAVVSVVKSANTAKPLTVDSETSRKVSAILDVFSRKGDGELRGAIGRMKAELKRVARKTVPDILETRPRRDKTEIGKG